MPGEHHRCAICAAEFASSAELIRHEKGRHTQQRVSGVNPGNESRADQSGPDATQRQNHEFTRRNME